MQGFVSDCDSMILFAVLLSVFVAFAMAKACDDETRRDLRRDEARFNREWRV